MDFVGLHDHIGEMFSYMEPAGGSGSGSSNKSSAKSTSSNNSKEEVDVELEEVTIKGKKGVSSYNMMLLNNALLNAIEKQLANLDISDLYSLAGKGNWFFGTSGSLSLFTGAVQSRNMYTQGIRKGISGNYQLTGRNLSQFGKMTMTEATKPITRIGKFAKFAGHGSFYLGIAFDTAGIINGDISIGKGLLNTGFGALGNWGGSNGAAISIVYFGVDNFYPGGWPGIYSDGNDAQRVLDEGFNKAGPYRINLFGAHEPK